MKRIIITIFIVSFGLTMQSQSDLNSGLNPFKQFGYTPKIATLSNGKYVESFDDDTIVQIGTVLFNTRSRKIVELFVVEDTSEIKMPPPDVASMWISPDPLFAERPEWTPYNYCQNNPINRIDPSGLLDDNYTVDKQGNTKLVEKTNDKFDMLYTEDSWESGAKDKSIKLDKGVMGSKWSATKTSNGKTYNMDFYNITGDDKASGLLEFLDENTNVEWSQTMVGTSANQPNVMSTTHLESSEAGQSYIFNRGYTIRGHNHSHPYNNVPSEGDKSWADKLHYKFPEAILKILHQGSYYQYDKQGIILQGNFPEIIIR